MMLKIKFLNSFREIVKRKQTIASQNQLLVEGGCIFKSLSFLLHSSNPCSEEWFCV